MSYKLVLSASIFAVTVVAGCAIVPMPGEKPGAVPPRIVTNSDKQKTWNDATAFGQVPAELKAAGDAVCAPMKAYAAGYHPLAQDENGKAFPGGGYYCVLKQ